MSGYPIPIQRKNVGGHGIAKPIIFTIIPHLQDDRIVGGTSRSKNCSSHVCANDRRVAFGQPRVKFDLHTEKYVKILNSSINRGVSIPDLYRHPQLLCQGLKRLPREKARPRRCCFG